MVDPPGLEPGTSGTRTQRLASSTTGHFAGLINASIRGVKYAGVRFWCGVFYMLVAQSC